MKGFIIHVANVVHDVDDKPRILVGVEEEHVPKRAVGEGRAEHGDIVALCPVADRAGVIDLSAQPFNDLQMTSLGVRQEHRCYDTSMRRLIRQAD
jgi:hypothetical protein